MPSELIGGLLVYARHEHWLTGNVAFPLRMIGRDSIVEMSSSAVSLSRANVVGDAIGGASDITGNAGTIIVGSYRTIRASASDGTSIRIGRYASATVISALLNEVRVRLFGVSLSVGDIAVRVGSVVVIYACGFARGQPWSEIFCRAFTCWSFLVG